MHRGRIAAFDEVRFVAVSGEQRLQFFMRDARENGGICDFVPVKVQHWQHGSIADGIQEFVRMPGGRKRTSLCLPIAYRDCDDEIGIIECCSVRVRDGVTKFAAFVDGTGVLRCAVRTYASRKRKLPEEFEHARFVAALIRINLGVVAFEITVGQRSWRAMPGTGNINDIQIILLDEPIQVDPNQGLARIGAPMTQEPILDVLRLQRLAEKRVPAKINHAHRQIVASSPVGVDLPQLFGRKRRLNFGCASHRFLLE